MQNLHTMTELIRALAGRPMGFSYVYQLPEGKSYGQTVNSLLATAGRESVKISTSQILIVDPATLATIAAIKITVK